MRFTAIDSGGYRTCGIREDGSAHCWEPDDPYSRLGPEGRYTSISTSWGTCALRDDGSAVCWSDGHWQPESPPEDHHFKAISVNDSHICALRDDGAPVYWGWGDFGQAFPPAGELFPKLALIPNPPKDGLGDSP